MMKKTKILFIVLIILFVGCFLVASQASAQGIVPCGRSEDVPDPRNIDETADCTLCHFFILIEIILEFVFFKLTPPLALLMLIIGGGMFVLAAGNPKTIIVARKIISSVLIGIAIIYGAFFLVGIFLSSIGLAEWTETMYSQWWNHGIFTIDCDVPMSAPILDQTSTQTSTQTSAPISNVFNPPIEPTAVLTSIPINKSFSSNGNLFTFHTEPIYSIFATGKTTLNESDSYVRIILTDAQEKQYLIYEAAGPFDSGSFSFESNCQETCVLNGVMPKSVDVELFNARLDITALSTLEDKQALKTVVHTMGMEPYQGKINESREQIMIDRINQYIEENNLKWRAGHTSVSGLSYAEKKKMLGVCSETPDNLPNLQGFEYYKEGIFNTTSAEGITPTPSNLPEYFDWRNRHGENWLTSIRNQGPCGSCWAFGSTAAVEAVINLYYNQHLDVDLSEQDALSCMPNPSYRRSWVNSCRGGYPNDVLNYYNNHGVVIESCFPYQAKDIECNRCSGFYGNAIIKTGKPEMFFLRSTEEEKLKEKIIEKGPISTAIASWRHAMALVGWKINPETNNTVWIFKNSWGNRWGEDGYARLETPLSNLYMLSAVGVPMTIADYQPSIRCVDKDDDGYCNWGISENKPSNCPSKCKKEKDCDDSNPKLGPFDSNFNCQTIEDSSEKLINCKEKYGQDYWCSSYKDWEEECRGKGEKISLGKHEYCKSGHGAYQLCVTCKEEGADCRPNHTDSYDGKCEQDCDASPECDEKAPNSTWVSNNLCHQCNSICKYGYDAKKPPTYFLSKNYCYYNCLIECSTSGWRRTVDCDSEYCPKFRASDNRCDYERIGCTAESCRYSKSVPKPCAEAVCSENGWDKSACVSPLGSCYTKSESGSAQWLKCNSGDVMVGWYHWTNNWGNDEIKIKCCSLNSASLGSCSTNEKKGSEQLMNCGPGYVCTGKYHQTDNWGADNLKTECCELQNASLGSCYTKEVSGSKQWIECNSGDVITEWYHHTNNWGDDDIKIRCCSIE